MASTIALVRHQVADFDAWKTVYDSFAPVQAEHGVHAHQVLRSIEDPNDVTVTHTFDSREAARAFFAMPELKDVMGQAGVDADSIEISYFDEVETARSLARSQETADALFRGCGPAHLHASTTLRL